MQQTSPAISTFQQPPATIGAISTAPLQLQLPRTGWLRKTGVWNRSLKRRWVSLDSTKLMYSDMPSGSSKGEIFVADMVECRMATASERNGARIYGESFVFVVVCPGRTYFFAADSDADAQGWVYTLQGCIQQARSSGMQPNPDRVQAQQFERSLSDIVQPCTQQ